MHPNLTPFQKGQSGNPAGRPLGLRNKSTIAKKWLDVHVSIQNPMTQNFEKMPIEEGMILMQIGKALRGDTSAFRALMDMVYGSSVGQIEPAMDTPPIAQTAKDVEDRLKTILQSIKKQKKYP